MIIGGIVGLALAVYYGSGFFKAKGTDQAPTNADTAAAMTAGAAATATATATTTGSGATTSSCTDPLKADLQTQAALDIWSTATNNILNPLAIVTLTAAQTSQVATIESDIKAHMACLNELNTAAGSTTTRLAGLQTDAADLDTRIAQKKADVQIARDRAALALNPNLNRSYYDGWFPLERPLKHYSYPLLIGFGIFFLMIGFFVFMSLVGVNIEILIPKLTGPSGGTQFTPAFWVMGGISAVLLGLTIYGFTR
jgi:hypothetical protein